MQKMTTENPTLAAPQEPVSNADANVTNLAVEAVSDEQTASDAGISSAPQVPTINFEEEDAALAASDAGLDIEEHSSDEGGESADLLTGKSKAELVDYFAVILQNEPVQTLRHRVEAIKIEFYKLHRAEVEQEFKAFVAQGGDEANFVVSNDGYELRLKDLFKEYRTRRDEFIAGFESQKEENLKQKLAIIEELRQLTSSDETLNHTFTRFRELQAKWKDVGIVPAASVKDIWETYNLHVENFYNFIKINKELRDLDLKKNLELKSDLCEQAEALSLEASIVEAFKKLQKLHDEWRETGPVANEYKESLWERFKAASSRVNKLHQEHFESLKGEQVENLKAKTQLCEKCEELTRQVLASRKDWKKASDSLLELQKEWKTIGFAPKRDNNRIYERFRTACDAFFEAKRNFYAGVKSEMDNNLIIKSELCEAAEAIQNSEDWKSATDELIALQAKWKATGAVSRRHSEVIWKRFRTACDLFFERKAVHFASKDSEQNDNLKAKEALLEEMQQADIMAGGFEAIKEFQRRWSEIGFVPMKEKNSLHNRYTDIVDNMFQTLRGSERKESMNRFKNKVAASKGGNMRSEREKLANKVRNLESDIQLLENNIGFFSKSKGAEAMIADVHRKIAKAKQELADTIEKVKFLDKEQA